MEELKDMQVLTSSWGATAPTVEKIVKVILYLICMIDFLADFGGSEVVLEPL